MRKKPAIYRNCSCIIIMLTLVCACNKTGHKTVPAATEMPGNNNHTELVMPSASQEKKIIPGSDRYTITLIADSGQKIRWYEGMTVANIKTIGASQFPDFLEQKLKEHDEFKKTPAFVVKYADGCKYRDILEILDKIQASGVKDYSIGDISAPEREALNHTRNQQ